MDRDRSKCLNAGCNDFVTKPIQDGEVVQGDRPVFEGCAGGEAGGADEGMRRRRRRTAWLQAQKFYQELPAELSQIEQAIEREDRVQLKEVAQLLLGNAAAAGLKDVAPQAAKLMQSAESERSWDVLRQVVADFVHDAQPASQRQAA